MRAGLLLSLSCAATPLLVASLKAVTGIYCPRQLALMVAILLLSALLLTCVRLHRGWRRGAAVVLGVVSGFCCLALLEGEIDTTLYGSLILSSTLLLLVAIPLAAAAFSIWWALRAIRRAEPA